LNQHVHNHSRLVKTVIQLGRRRVTTGGVPFLTRPPPSCQDSSFPEWGTLRLVTTRERRSGKGASWRAGAGRVECCQFHRPTTGEGPSPPNRRGDY
jgi:hypothetical protein